MKVGEYLLLPAKGAVQRPHQGRLGLAVAPRVPDSGGPASKGLSVSGLPGGGFAESCCCASPVARFHALYDVMCYYTLLFSFYFRDYYTKSFVFCMLLIILII